jgi:hypothetical protein
MNAELTMMEVAAQKSDTAIPATGQLISGTLRAARTISDTPAIPAYIWCMILAITSDMIGAYWDVSWHLCVGRDTFWTPAHMAIQLCGVLGGLTSGFLFHPRNRRMGRTREGTRTHHRFQSKRRKSYQSPPSVPVPESCRIQRNGYHRRRSELFLFGFKMSRTSFPG